MLGHPPKVIWLRIGNSSTRQVISILHVNKAVVLEFCGDRDSSLLVLEG